MSLCTMQHAGFTLLEVLVAVSILSVGLLSYAQVSLISFKANKQNYFLNRITLKTEELAERMRSCNHSSICQHNELETWKQSILDPQIQISVTKISDNYQNRWHSNTLDKTVQLRFHA